MSDLSKEYFNIGDRADWDNPDNTRKMDINDEAKKVIIAVFLRFVHPINYFLTPNKKSTYL